MSSLTSAEVERLDRGIDVLETGPRHLGHGQRPVVTQYHFGLPEPRRAGYVIPSPRSLKPLSRVQLRELVRRSGLFPSSVCSVLTRLEMKLVLAETYPFEVGANYGVEARTINNPVELIVLCGDRRAVHNATQAAQTRIRRRDKVNTLGEAALMLDPRELIERTLAGKTFELVDPDPIYLKDRVAERFYDLDGRAGRASYYKFRDVESGDELPISPRVWFGTVRPDPSLMVHFRGTERLQPPRSRLSNVTRRRPKAERIGSVEVHFASFEVGL